jgi:LysM repeat protein
MVRVLRSALLAFALTAAAAPAAALADGAHKVQSGETLWSVAQTYGLELDDLAAANGLSDPYIVVVGDELTIPGGGAAAPESGSYVVKVGDTLWTISRIFGVSLDALAAANGLSDVHHVVAGSEIQIPGTTDASSPAYSGPWEVSAILDTEASAAGIDPTLVRALAWQESGWQQHVISGAGAVGVMQLMPETAAWVSDHLVGMELQYGASVHDNVRGGVAFLAHLLALSGWDVPTALGAYYQGWASVQANGMSEETWRYVNNILEIQTWFW